MYLYKNIKNKYFSAYSGVTTVSINIIKPFKFTRNILFISILILQKILNKLLMFFIKCSINSPLSALF